LFSQPQNSSGQKKNLKSPPVYETRDFAINRATSIFFTCGLPAGRKACDPNVERRDGVLSIIEVRIKTPQTSLRKKDCEIFHELGAGNSRHKQK
jgi:hypothetical protein